MADNKNLDKEQIMEKLEPVEEAVKAASQTVIEAAEKVAPAIKAAGKSVKETAGKAGPAVKKAAEKAAPAVKAASRTLRETGKKAADAGKRAASAIVPEIYFQWQGSEVLCSELADQAKAAYRAENKTGVHSCRVYIKPEDGTVYYVINGTEGKFPL